MQDRAGTTRAIHSETKGGKGMRVHEWKNLVFQVKEARKLIDKVAESLCSRGEFSLAREAEKFLPVFSNMLGLLEAACGEAFCNED